MLKVKAIFIPLKWYRIKALVARDAEATNKKFRKVQKDKPKRYQLVSTEPNDFRT